MTALSRPNIPSELRPLPPSRSSSFAPSFSRSNTAVYPPSLTSSSSQLPTASHEHVPLGSRLKHMFDSQKHATFSATVVVHELGNVPQLQGEFAVKWKFRGKRPRGKESLEVHAKEHAAIGTKPSLPNLKLSQALHMHPSSSSLSVRTTSTSSSIPPPTPRSVTPSSHTKISKAFSLPPVPLQRPNKKSSDPTPLKQVLVRQDSGGTPLAESPPVMDEPEELPDSILDNDSQYSRNGSGESSGSRGSSRSRASGLRINLHRPSVASSAIPTPRQSTPTDQLLVPFPRSVPSPSTQDLIPSGTTPSYSTLVDSLPSREALAFPNRHPISRTVSSTTSTSSDTSASTTGLQPRGRSVSGPGSMLNMTKADNGMSSVDRRGETPARPLRAHTCRWDYELSHVIRIPLGKPVMPSTSATPNGPNPYRQPPASAALPLLGSGPHSESGIQLVIEQFPIVPIPSRPAPDHDTKKHATGVEGAKARVEKTKTVFGVVDVDLAAFAGKGRMTRRFLLKGSRTNATVKLTIDMKWIGGEEKWTAPPIQEGHHVTGMSDLVGTEAETLRSDLFLTKTPSNSSSGSSLGLDRTKTNISTVSSIYASRSQSTNHSTTSLGRTLSNHHYETYDHFLKPDHSSRGRDTALRDVRESSPMSNRSPSRSRHSRESSPVRRSPDLALTGHGLAPSPLIMSLSNVHHHHHHHTHHMKGKDLQNRSGINDLPPEAIIEAIFNPHPAAEAGPFTYVPVQRQDDLPGPDDLLDQIATEVNGEEKEAGDETKENKAKSRLWRMRGRGRGESKKVRGERQRTAST
ncbi:hypothetical protein CI109_105046 [Kwoniella shandongensis]|uniref:Uncharacterized protein n=1 Tax=Kwoniella shandongensis TaxID=1734106 RepID=A0A5M6C125_9TREE|nr:uncharacterized protein CI109_004355 [Kwoniella shandongensis]KAA5527295.1 hypothetical protein CI109_004355 [Kwoniella shandongensis]